MYVRRSITATILALVLVLCLPIARPTPQLKLYEVEEVLRMRFDFIDLFGKPPGDAIRRFGHPHSTGADFMDFVPAPNGWGGISVQFAEGKIFGVKLFASPTQTLDVRKVVQKGQLFCFHSGAFSSSTEQYFSAETKDGATDIQFSIGGPSVVLMAVIFNEDGKSCDPSKVAR